jgi:hypothetical protein
MIASGEKKGLILPGRTSSEQAGMGYRSEWLKSFIPEAPVEFIHEEEPFRRSGFGFCRS